MQFRWMKRGDVIGRPRKSGYSAYVGEVHVSFTRPLADNLNDGRICWGVDSDGKLVFRIDAAGEDDSYLVRDGQSSARVLRRMAIEPGTRIHFEFGEDDIFHEARREVATHPF